MLANCMWNNTKTPFEICTLFNSLTVHIKYTSNMAAWFIISISMRVLTSCVSHIVNNVIGNLASHLSKSSGVNIVRSDKSTNFVVVNKYCWYKFLLIICTVMNIVVNICPICTNGHSTEHLRFVYTFRDKSTIMHIMHTPPIPIAAIKNEIWLLRFYMYLLLCESFLYCVIFPLSVPKLFIVWNLSV